MFDNVDLTEIFNKRCFFRKMPKQQLDLIDYFGALAAWIVFFSAIFIISVTCILWCCVSKYDDKTVFSKVYFYYGFYFCVKFFLF